jgi:uncharacterized protein (TIGR03083 family)
MDAPELSAFVEECRAADRTLAGVPDEAWRRAALGEWTLAELVAHLARGANRIAAYLGAEPGAEAPVCDRVGYFRATTEPSGTDPAAAADRAAVAARARAEAATVDPADLPARFAAGWRASAEAAGREPASRLIATIVGPMRLDEYLATRVLEVVVHHGDVRAALDLPPVATPLAGRLTMELLEGLLGGPRPRAMGRARFIAAATGRLAVDDPRFPILR